MKALVTYYSQSGNTKTIAHAIYDALTCEKEIKSIGDAGTAEGYDVIYCGFPVHAHSVPPKAQGFIKNMAPGQKVAFFTTHGSLRGGQLPMQALEDALGLAVKAKVLGSFGCRGKVEPKLLEKLSKMPEHQKWAEEALGANEHPTAADLEDAADFALNILKKT
ncbi:MAG: flavodoxin family protein [Syntrophales bacterium]|nr:flavodoxin family protein [Syntrophales bacterium]